MIGSMMNRRSVVQGLAATGAVLGASVPTARALQTSAEFANGKFETRPNFNTTPLRRIAGLRPHRDVTYLLTRQDYGTKAVFHNYGHGGGGITMSWGCAQEIVDLIKASKLLDTEKKIVVVGAGRHGSDGSNCVAPAYAERQHKDFRRRVLSRHNVQCCGRAVVADQRGI